MGFQNEALKLFLTQNINEAKEITNKLNEYNNQRQQTEKRIYEEAIKEIEQEKTSVKKELPCLILGKENWHHGVIGIVSSKITDLYFKPSILICFENEEGKGSGRSIPGFDLHEALMKCSTFVDKFGGHSMAIGINVKKENFKKFKEEMEEYASKSNICDIIPIINVDKEISLKEINIELVKDINLLEPFGEANKMPIFLMKNLKIQSIRTLSNGKHIKLNLGQEGYIIDAIGFNLGHMAENYQIGDKVDVVGNLEINNYRKEEQIQMVIKDFRKTTN